MYRSGMLVDNDFLPINEAMFKRLWRGIIISGAVLGLIFGALSIWFAHNQYQKVIGQHFDNGDFVNLENINLIDVQPYNLNMKIYPPTYVYEYDWSVASLINEHSTGKNPDIDRDSNRDFSFFVYMIYLGLFMAVFFFIIAWLIVTAAAASLTMFSQPGIRLIPIRDHEDPRLGFEALENTFLFTLVAIFIAYFVAYLVVLQNLYLRVADLSFGEFFIGTVGRAANSFKNIDGSDPLQRLAVAVGFIAGDGTSGEIVKSTDGFIISMVSILIILIVLGMLLFILRIVMKHGHSRYAAHLNEKLPPIMTWPMTRPRVRTLLVALFLATVALFLFRLGALLFAGAIALSLFVIWRQIKSGKTES
jgi:hypothetical protein